jgi:hypothetical protein
MVMVVVVLLVVGVVVAALWLSGGEVAETVAVRAHPQVAALLQDHVQHRRCCREQLQGNRTPERQVSMVT